MILNGPSRYGIVFAELITFIISCFSVKIIFHIKPIKIPFNIPGKVFLAAFPSLSKNYVHNHNDFYSSTNKTLLIVE